MISKVAGRNMTWVIGKSVREDRSRRTIRDIIVQKGERLCMK